MILRRRVRAPEGEVARVVREHGRHSLAALAEQEDKHHLLVAGGRGLVAYAVRGQVAFAAGDPLCAEADLEPAAREGLAAERPPERVDALRLRGVRDALARLSPARPALAEAGGGGDRGPRFLQPRRRDNAPRCGRWSRRSGLALTVRRYDRAAAPDSMLEPRLAEVSAEWLAGRRLGEMGFSLGRFSLDALDTACRVRLPRPRPRRGVHGVAALPQRPCGRPRPDAPARGGLSRRDGPARVRSLELLRQAGLEEASLANAPLADASGSTDAVSRVLAAAAKAIAPVYGYRDLFRFKKKFAPRGGALPRLSARRAAARGLRARARPRRGRTAAADARSLMREARVVLAAVAAAAAAFVLAIGFERQLVRLLSLDLGELEWVSDVVLSTALGVATFLWLHLRAPAPS